MNDLKVNKYQLEHEGSLPPEQTNPEEVLDDAGSYSSETEDERQLKELDEEYINEMMTTYRDKNEVYMKKS
jgi:hypothetical protein